MDTLGPHPLYWFSEERSAFVTTAASHHFEYNVTGMEQRMQARVAREHHSRVLRMHNSDVAVLAMPRGGQCVSRVICTGQLLRKNQVTRQAARRRHGSMTSEKQAHKAT